MGSVPWTIHHRAMALLDGETDRFFLLTDDIEWVSEKFRGRDKVHIVSDGKNTNVEEMYLSSLCQHNIMANSTFSWWGAWINENPGKRAICPRPWFQAQGMDTKDLIVPVDGREYEKTPSRLPLPWPSWALSFRPWWSLPSPGS